MAVAGVALLTLSLRSPGSRMTLLECLLLGSATAFLNDLFGRILVAIANSVRLA